jgi:hypothetical protein
VITDNLAPLFGGGEPGVRFRQGVIESWNAATGENSVSMAGGLLINVPILNTGEAIALRAGHVVGLLGQGRTWFILGRVTPSGDPNFAGASVAFATIGNQVTGIGINGTQTVKVSASTTAPTWADEALVMLTATCTAVNSDPANVAGQAILVPRINGAIGIANTVGVGAANVPFGNLASLAGTKSSIITNPGVITVDAQIYTNGATWPANPLTAAAVDAIAVFRSTT